MISRYTAASALAIAGTLAGASVAASAATAAPARTMPAPAGWHRLGGLNEAAYCASATPSMGVAVARDRVNWDCVLTVRLPKPPGTLHQYLYQITQTDACKWEYPSHASKVKAIDSPASPPALGWSCYIPIPVM